MESCLESQGNCQDESQGSTSTTRKKEGAHENDRTARSAGSGATLFDRDPRRHGLVLTDGNIAETRKPKLAHKAINPPRKGEDK